MIVRNPRGFDAQRCATIRKGASPFMTVVEAGRIAAAWRVPHTFLAQLDAKLVQHALGFFGSEVGDHLVPER
jgi:hypothetical protein